MEEFKKLYFLSLIFEPNFFGQGGDVEPLRTLALGVFVFYSECLDLM